MNRRLKTTIEPDAFPGIMMSLPWGALAAGSMPRTQLEELTALRRPPSWIWGRERKQGTAGRDAKGRERAGKKRGGSITHCNFANLSVLRAIYFVQCKTRIQRTDSLYYTTRHTKQTK